MAAKNKGHPTASTSPQLWGSFRHFKLAIARVCWLRMPAQLRYSSPESVAVSSCVCCGPYLEYFGISWSPMDNMWAQRQHNVQHATYLWWRLFCWTVEQNMFHPLWHRLTIFDLCFEHIKPEETLDGEFNIITSRSSLQVLFPPNSSDFSIIMIPYGFVWK